MSQTNSNSTKPIRCTKFDINNFTVTDLDLDSKIKSTQFMSYPHYKTGNKKEGQMVFKTDWIDLTQYGLASIGKFCKSDDDRNFLKIPLDPSQQSCQELRQMLEQIDDYGLISVYIQRFSCRKES